MDENLGLAILRDLQQQSSQFHNTDEFMQYMKDADIALETVKNILLEDGPPEKVLQRRAIVVGAGAIDNNVDDITNDLISSVFPAVCILTDRVR